MKWPFIFFSVIIFCFLFFSSCKKDSFITSPNALAGGISVDSIKFDTVFTTVGSITKSFTIVNLNDQKILLSKVQLMGGNASSFKININGIAASEADNIEIDANDSIHVFVSVNINPNATNLPFIVSDSILINCNGQNNYVQLQAYGQNAHFINNQVITGNINWTDSLPYVILGELRIDTLATLTIEPGCKIYAHANAPVLVDGTLICDSATFTGDRLDAAYSSLPGSWPGIYFRGASKDNVLTHANIKNAYQAIVADSSSPNANPKVVLHQCMIDNASEAGILCTNSSLDADNSLITNCGSNINITAGGVYHFINCTVAAYGTNYIAHKNPVLQINNYMLQGSLTVTDNLNALFQNCIFWGDNGSVTNEIAVDKRGSSAFNITLDHSLYKVMDDPANTDTIAVIKNQDPEFDNVDLKNMIFDFHISSPSAPGIGKGIMTSFQYDLDGLTRSINGLTDLGCYEKH
ncbi:MAG: hypothetical protein WDM71_03740 [Ferruginibacter sp.]